MAAFAGLLPPDAGVFVVGGGGGVGVIFVFVCLLTMSCKSFLPMLT